MKVLIIVILIIIVLLVGVLIFQNEISRRTMLRKPDPIVVGSLSSTVETQLSQLLSSALSSFTPSGGGLSRSDMLSALKEALQWSASNLQHEVIATQGGTWTVNLSTATLEAIETKFKSALGSTLLNVQVQGGEIVATLDGTSLAALENISVDVTGLIPLTIAGYDANALSQLQTIFSNLGSQCCSQPVLIDATSISALATQLQGLGVSATVSGPVTISSQSISDIATAIAGKTMTVSISGQPLSVTGTVNLGDVSALTDWLAAHSLNINDSAIINAINNFRDATKALNVTKTLVCYRTKQTGLQVFKGYEYETFYSDGNSNIVIKDMARRELKPDQYELVDCSCNNTCSYQKALVQCDWAAFDSPYYQFRVGAGNWFSYYPIKSDEGLIYEFRSFIVNGVEQLSSFFYYTILNPGRTPSFPPYADEGIVVYGSDINHIANFTIMFGTLFKTLGLQNDWQCILNPEGSKNPNVFRFLYPKDAGTWSMRIVRYDGVEYVYTSDGVLSRSDGSWDSNISGYTYCSLPSDVISTAPVECQYLCWDRANPEQQKAATPFTWTVSMFAINGIPMLNAPFSRTYQGSNIISSPDGTFSLNNEMFLNDMFSSLSLGWTARVTAQNTFNINYLGNVQEFVLVIIRNNGQRYVYRQGGRSSNYDGFVGDDFYPLRCGPVGSKLRQSSKPKTLKLTTPLSNPPPKNHTQIKGVLRQRLELLRNLLQNKLGSKHFKLCLFGSQIKGVSSSGHPDIDVWIVTNKLDPRLKTIIESVKEEVDFKVDLTWISNETLKKMTYVEFK